MVKLFNWLWKSLNTLMRTRDMTNAIEAIDWYLSEWLSLSMVSMIDMNGFDHNITTIIAEHSETLPTFGHKVNCSLRPEWSAAECRTCVPTDSSDLECSPKMKIFARSSMTSIANRRPNVRRLMARNNDASDLSPTSKHWSLDCLSRGFEWYRSEFFASHSPDHCLSSREPFEYQSHPTLVSFCPYNPYDPSPNQR